MHAFESQDAPSHRSASGEAPETWNRLRKQPPIAAHPVALADRDWNSISRQPLSNPSAQQHLSAVPPPAKARPNASSKSPHRNDPTRQKSQSSLGFVTSRITRN